LNSTLSSKQAKALIEGTIADPFSLLGAHPIELDDGQAVVVRSFLPGAKSVSVMDLDSEKEIIASLVHKAGIFEAILTSDISIAPYRLKVDFGNSTVSKFYDCYSFLPVLSDYDLHLYNQGNHYNIYEKLGAHPWTHQNIKGVLFAVWAPSASRVSVIGDFNQWDGRRHQMRNRGSSGVWELFVPHLGKDLLYKFEIRTGNGTILIKADPFAFRFEQRPKTAAIVQDLEVFSLPFHAIQCLGNSV